MPKILISGNGFDINFGLPTKYGDFISILNFTQTNQIDFDSVYSNSSNYDQILINFKKFELDSEKIQLIRNLSKYNLWYQFFKNEYEIETWIDFENKIEYVLKILFSSIEYLKENIFSKGSLSENKLTYKSQLFNNNIEIIQVLDTFNIISYDENYSVILNKDYLIKKYQFYIDADLDKISKRLYAELLDFKKMFSYYFETFVFPFYDNMKAKVDTRLFLRINKHYTFNYTPTFDRIYKKRVATQFLHGKIDSSLNKIVLGINEIPDGKLDKRFFLPFTKYFQKLNNNTDYNFLKDYEKRKSSNFMFFFMGHSLDKSDEDYINEVFNFINNSKAKVKRITVIFHSEQAKSKLLINLLNIRGKKDVQELMKSKVLQFRHIDSKELKQDLIKDISTPVIDPSAF